MKKKLWMLGAAVAALTSCTQSEVVDVPVLESKPIGFDTYVDKSTRAANHNLGDVTTSNISMFHVFGYSIKYDTNKQYSGNWTEVFENVPVERKDGVWSYVTDEQGLKYWDKDKTYRFAAYANGNETEGDVSATNITNTVTYNPQYVASATDNSNPIMDYLEFPNYEAGNKDLVAAIFGDVDTNTGLPVDGYSVDFRFRHMLSKIFIDFALISELDYSNIVISDIKITNAVNKTTGRMIYGTPNNTITWDTSATGAEKNGYSSTESLTLTTTAQYAVAYVIPQDLVLDSTAPTNNTILSFTVSNYEKNDDGTSSEATTHEPKAYTFNLNQNTDETKSWLPGCAYHYIIRFGKADDSEPIVFGVSEVVDWTNGFTSASITLQSGTSTTSEE